MKDLEMDGTVHFPSQYAVLDCYSSGQSATAWVLTMTPFTRHDDSTDKARRQSAASSFQSSPPPLQSSPQSQHLKTSALLYHVSLSLHNDLRLCWRHAGIPTSVPRAQTQRQRFQMIMRMTIVIHFCA